MAEIRVVIVDDHPLFRSGIRDRLTRNGCPIEVQGEAGDGAEAIELAQRLHPDVMLMDIAMPGMNGIEATQRIKETCPKVSVLILTAYDDEQYIFALLEVGAAGYLLKTADGSELSDAICRVHEGEPVLSPEIARKVLARFASETPGRETADAQTLSPRELEVLRLAARGIRNKEIAAALTMSVRTVQNHLSHIFNKLGVASRTEAVVIGLRNGWLALDDLT